MTAKKGIAIAVAVALVAVGLSMMPYAGASVDCTTSDYTLPSVEPLTARSLNANDDEIGFRSLSSGASDQTFEIKKTDSAGVIEWTMYMDDGSGCAEYTDGDCDKNRELVDTQSARCTLIADSGNDRDFFVHVLETDGDDTAYKAWAA